MCLCVRESHTWSVWQRLQATYGQARLLCLLSRENIKRWILYPPPEHPIATPWYKSHPKGAIYGTIRANLWAPRKWRQFRGVGWKMARTFLGLHKLPRSSAFLHNFLKMDRGLESQAYIHLNGGVSVHLPVFLVHSEDIFLLSSGYKHDFNKWRQWD